MNTEDRIYQALADRFVPFKQLIDIPCVESGDPMANLESYGLLVRMDLSKLPPSTGDALYLRSQVCSLLVNAQKNLSKRYSGLTLALVYAYRSMAIQKSSFENMQIQMGLNGKSDDESLEKIHHFIAVPSVAGHPTGGAIDLTILDPKGKELDFGTPLHTLERTSYAYSPYISDQATINRKLLRSVMIESGFAPYDGEWWHYSFGEKEWAAYYGEPQAIYTQMDYDGENFF